MIQSSTTTMFSRLKTKLLDHHLLDVRFDSDKVYTAGSDVSGSVSFSPANVSKKGINEIVAQLRCTQVSCYVDQNFGALFNRARSF